MKDLFLRKYAYVIGMQNEFSIEKRIFHFICLILAVVSLIGSFVNLFFQMPYWIVLFAFTFPAVPVIFYYLSRFRNRFALAKSLFLLSCYSFIMLFWFFNAGLNGYIHLLLFTVIIWQLIFASKNQYLWLLLNFVIAVYLSVTTYYHPDWIIWDYSSLSDKVIDFNFTYIVMGISTYFIFQALMKEYKKEQQTSNRMNKELIAVNEKLQQSIAEVEKINQTKNKLFSVVSHDIRTFAGSINNFSQLLLDPEYSKDEEKDLRCKKYIYDSSKNLNSVLENVLSWSRIQMNAIEADKRELDMVKIIQESILLFDFWIKEKQLNVNVRIGTNGKVVADIEMANCIVRNVLSNAIKFSYTGGNIEIDLREKKSSRLIELIITDNGVGMSDEELELLKQSNNFYSGVGTKKEKGTGLGFTISNEFAEMNGGYIKVSSKKGIGSELVLGLPKVLE